MDRDEARVMVFAVLRLRDFLETLHQGPIPLRTAELMMVMLMAYLKEAHPNE